MKIVVLGAGGVGGYFGGRIAASGGDVTFIARGPHLEALRRDGLRITSPLGDAHIEPVKALESIHDVPSADLVIVGVKLWDSDAVAKSLQPIVSRGAAVVSFQNGVQKDDVLRAHLPASAVLGGVAYIAAVIAAPGVIAHSGKMQRLVIGEYDDTESPRTDAFLAACRAGGFEAERSDAIERAIWEKFVFLVGFSGTTSLFREPIGFIREDADRRALLHDAMREVVAVGLAKGVPLRGDFADDRLAFADTLPPTMTSSMAGDLARGNRLELPWLSGAVVDMGRTVGVETPANRRIADALADFVDGGVR